MGDPLYYEVKIGDERYARFYQDGPVAPLCDESRQAELAYRRAFCTAVFRYIVDWTQPDRECVDEAWQARFRARRMAIVRVGSRQVYRLGHAVESARRRGWCQALAGTCDDWEERLARKTVGAEGGPAEMVPGWARCVALWAVQPLTGRICPPPRLSDNWWGDPPPDGREVARG